jgi:murein DD-endopeptidase MepM/ murein hydrolase activator NlpD
LQGLEYKKRDGNHLKKYALGIFLLLAIFALSYGAYKIFFVPDPVVEGIEDFKFLSSEKTVQLHGRNLNSIEVTVSQGIQNIDAPVEDISENGESVYKISIKPEEMGLHDGPAIVTVKVRSGVFKTNEFIIKSQIDTVPPTLEVINATGILKQGAGGVAVLNATGEASVSVVIDNLQFEAFKTEQEDTDETSRYIAFFPVPYHVMKGTVFYATSTDIAGNRTVKSLPTRIKKVNFKNSSIKVTDGFIKQIILPLLDLTELADPAQAFKRINEEWRVRDLELLLKITKNVEKRKLWNGSFLQLKNSKVMASYGDQRTYFYEGEPISRSVHLGYDLASVANAPVGASNSGIVKFTGVLGIYGKTIVIDHGLGLLSLYGHLSEILVKEGQEIEKGDVIAKTGSSGFAEGDHLHFSILIQGTEVSPLFWWDPNWIKAKIDDILL